MTTQNEIIEKLDLTADQTVKVKEAYEAVLVSDGEKDVELYDGTTTPNLNKRLAGMVQAVKSVNGKDGEVNITREDLNIPSDEQLARQNKEDRFVITEDGRTQREVNLTKVDRGDLVLALEPKADKIYVDQLVINANKGMNNFKTQVELLAFRPTTTNYTGYALDTKKTFLWDGSKWNDTGLSELDLAKNYIDSFDQSTLNSGKPYPFKALTRKDVVSPINKRFADFILDIQVLGARDDKYYKINLFMNGSTNSGWKKTGWSIAEYDVNTFAETESYSDSDLVIKPWDEQAEVNRTGIDEILLISKNVANLKLKIKYDGSKLPTTGLTLNSTTVTNDGYSWIIDPMCYSNYVDDTFVKAQLENTLVDSKKYTDDLVKNVTAYTLADLNNLREIGTFRLVAGGTFSNLPSGIKLTEDIIVENKPATNTGFYFQTVKNITGIPAWNRYCNINIGTGVWRSTFSRAQGDLDGVDPLSVTNSGEYLLKNGLNLPTGFSSNALLTVESVGAFTVRTIKELYNPSKCFIKVNTGNWFPNFLVTNSSLASNYNYRGLISTGSCNDITADGNYLVSAAVKDRPSFLQAGESLWLSVDVFGPYFLQQARTNSNPDVIAQRKFKSTPSGNMFEDWVLVGSNKSGGSTSNLSDKHIVFIGDSMIENGDYPARIGLRFGIEVDGFGFGGCRAAKYSSSPLGYDKQSMYNIAKNIATGDYTSLIDGATYTKDNNNDDNTPQAYGIANTDWSKVDVLCIAFGTNDWTGSTLGETLDPDENGNTYKGALSYAVETIQRAHPHIQIVLIGMSFRLREMRGDVNVNSDNTTNFVGKFLREYQQALFEVAEKYHIPAFDMLNKSGINVFNQSIYLGDGIHPKNGSGYQHFANKVGSFLNSVL